MDNDSQVLKEKALLLINRERELHTLRNKHQRLLNWLSLAQSLPEVVDRRFSLAEIGTKFVHRIISAIKLQRVHLLELTAEGVRPLGTDQPLKPPLPAQTMECLTKVRSGMFNQPEGDCQAALADSVGLHRLLWYRFELWQDKMVLLVGGFDQERGASYMPFDQEDAEHFAHTGQHFESLLSNLLLLFELEQEKLHLERFNEELELRVQERTEELGRANQEITQALSALREKDRRLSEDLEQSRSFQQSILPVLPQTLGIEFGAIYQPLDMVGGDIYDVAAICRDHFRIFIADATGHGVQASMRTIVIKSEYDRLKHVHDSPDSLLSELNRRLVRQYAEREMLCTACCFDIKLDANGATLHYSNAGHPALFRRSRTGVSEVYHDGPLLGLMPEVSLEVQELSLDCEDLLIAYTDGISDQLGLRHEQFELQAAISRHFASGQPLAQAAQDLLSSFTNFCGSAPVCDDVTLVALRINSSRDEIQ
jgi:serine phosphatase RsbU (regulator of sigma subunit)